MGGLRRGMPVTFWCMAVGLARWPGCRRWPASGARTAVLDRRGAALDGSRPGAAWVGWLVWLRRGWSASRSPPGTRPGCCCVPSSARRAARPPSTRTSRPGRCAGRCCCSPCPAALLGFAGLRRRVRATGWASTRRCASTGTATIVPLVCCWPASAVAWFAWRRDPAADPARALGPPRPVFGRGVLPRRRPGRPGRPAGARRWPGRCAAATSRSWTARSRAPAGAALGLGAVLGRAAPGRAAPGGDRGARRRAADRPGRRATDRGYPMSLGQVAAGGDARAARARRGRRGLRAGRLDRAAGSPAPVAAALTLVASLLLLTGGEHRRVRPGRPDPALALRSTCPGRPASTCGSTSASTASPTRWWC